MYPAGSPAPTVSLAGEPQLIANIQVEELYFNSKGQIIPSVSGKVGPNAEITATDAAHMNQYLDANPSIKKDLLETLKKQGHNFDEEIKKKYPKIENYKDSNSVFQNDLQIGEISQNKILDIIKKKYPKIFNPSGG